MATRVKARQGQQGASLKANWRHVFLERLAETSNVTQACAACEAEPSFVYKVRRELPEFRKAWGEALLEGYEHLEMETLHRLRFGTGPDDPKFDIPNALRLLAAHKETVARERARRGKRDEAEVLASLKNKLEAMRQRQIAAKKMLIEDGRTIDAGANAGA
ncbi:MAG: hypothetical protein WBA68_08185 [Alteraurantiacibacter sp.]